MPKQDGSGRKHIPDLEYNEALKNEDNIKIMGAVKNKYRKSIPEDELERCGMIALWRTLKKHEMGRQKFTTSLTRFTNWECLRWIRDNKPKLRYQLEKETSDIPQYVNECLSKIPEGELIREFYLWNEKVDVIADRHHKSVKEIKSAISVGVEKLKKIMEANYGREFCS